LNPPALLSTVNQRSRSAETTLGYGNEQAKKVRQAGKKDKGTKEGTKAKETGLTKKDESATIFPVEPDAVPQAPKDGTGGAGVRIVGKIDREMFKAISENIATDEVVLTDRQREHIISSRPKTFERYEERIQEILTSPDFIFEDPKHTDTALLIKRYKNAAEVVLRLATDEDGKKNSIITLWEIKESRLQRYLLTHKVLYKKE
jgi:hypothetical protein